ncbi:hypothetical protein [Glutamicibacter sp.]|uniref:hypothetical protein n=2 Tax=Glutamicibacter sp. TaxID=1931995 RepID=UPI002B473F28|nr:hypothetical protein [Glutamicibacter sp.]HJX78416.1 hypothetical protein [Glutamicibacter sp.]
MNVMVGEKKALPSVDTSWQRLPLISSILWLILLLVVDPVLVDAPWWSYLDFSFWFALVLPLIPWLGIAGLMSILGKAVSSRLSRVLLSLIALAMGIIPSTVWALLLNDVFDAVSSLPLSLKVSLAAGTVAVPLSLIVLARTLVARRKKVRVTTSAFNNGYEGQPDQ